MACLYANKFFHKHKHNLSQNMFHTSLYLCASFITEQKLTTYLATKEHGHD